MLCHPRDADVSLPALIRTLTQNSPEQTVPQSEPIVMEDEVDLVYEGRIGLERMERWGMCFCFLHYEISVDESIMIWVVILFNFIQPFKYDCLMCGFMENTIYIPSKLIN